MTVPGVAEPGVLAHELLTVWIVLGQLAMVVYICYESAGVRVKNEAKAYSFYICATLWGLCQTQEFF